MNHSVSEQDSILIEMNAILEELNSVIFTITTLSALHSQIKSNLNLLKNEINNDISGMKQLKSSLVTIIDMYQNSEATIYKHMTGDTTKTPNSKPDSDSNSEEDKAVNDIIDQLDKDYKDGKIDKDTYNSLRSGLLATGLAFLQNAATTKLTDRTVEYLADNLYSWIQHNTTAFMDRGLVGALAGGGSSMLTETPSFLQSVIRGSAKYGIPIIGTALDFYLQTAGGTNALDAAIKSVGHTGIGIGSQMAGGAIGAKVGALLGTAIPIPGVGTAIGTAAGFVIGVAGSMAFDYVYDNWDSIVETGTKLATSAIDTGKEILDDVGDAVSGFFGSIGDALFG